jgi:catechol 2,3-dioxygenase-like lactoylglutathione lyase family enzyme
VASRFDLVTIDTPDTARLAGFWAAVLDLVELEREDGDRWLVLGDRNGRRRLGFQRGTHRAGGTHLDLACAPVAFDAEVARLTALGAVLLGTPRREPYGAIANLRDPDGNAFDLCAYGE